MSGRQPHPHPRPHSQPHLQPHCHPSPNIILTAIPNLTPIITYTPRLISTVIPIANLILFTPTPNVILLISILTIPIPKLIHTSNLVPTIIPILSLILLFIPILTIPETQLHPHHHPQLHPTFLFRGVGSPKMKCVPSGSSGPSSGRGPGRKVLGTWLERGGEGVEGVDRSLEGSQLQSPLVLLLLLQLEDMAGASFQTSLPGSGEREEEDQALPWDTCPGMGEQGHALTWGVSGRWVPEHQRAGREAGEHCCCHHLINAGLA